MLGSPVQHIAFSPNSLYFATCVAANIVHTYGMKGDSMVRLSTYHRMLTPKQCRPPYHGVTAIALYFPSSLVFLTQL